MSLRDELLKVGLINKKQADEAERKLQRQERQPPRHGARGSKPSKTTAQAPRHSGAPTAAAGPTPTPAPPAAPAALPYVDPSHRAAAAKVARDMELNRKIQQRAEKKARHAQLAQMIQQHRLAPVESSEAYSFIDGDKIRRIPVTADIRAGLISGAILIVRHDARYDLVPASLAERLRERDPAIFIAAGGATDGAVEDDAYTQFPIPDDLHW